MNQNNELTPDKYLNAYELSQLLKKAEELYIIGTTKKRKALVRDWLIIQTAIFTGMRRSEISNLKVENLRIGNGQSHIILTTRKGGKKDQVIHVGKDFKSTLKKYLQWKMDNNELTPGSYLLRNERCEKYTPAGLWYRWKKYCPKKMHSARHTFATMTYQATKSLRLVQKQLSHSKITTTQIYADVSPEEICIGMNSMEALTRSLCRSA